MILNYGTVVEDLGGGVMRDSKLQACTALIGEGGEQAITVRIPKPSSASPQSPYNIVVSGIEDSSIEVSVP
jgi:phage terminase large subunit-like protein